VDAPRAQGGDMKTLHLLLGAQSLILVAASVNRLWDATDVAVLPHGALRLSTCSTCW
jgi:hypothetical protein